MARRQVYLDSMCLEDGEPWEAGSTGMGGFIGGVSSSIIIVPLLSWYDDNTGSIGGMKKLNPPEVNTCFCFPTCFLCCFLSFQQIHSCVHHGGGM